MVAVVDTGLDYLHPDIAENVWVNPGEDLNGNGQVDEEDRNGVDDDDNGFVDDLRGFDFANSLDADLDGEYDGENDVSDADPFDDNGHGTHVAGTIAAASGNGIGIAGVAPAARIMPLKGFGASGSAPDSVLWRAVLYAAENGAQVVNNSWSCRPLCPTNPLADEVVEIAHALDVVIVTSAGNSQQDVVFNSPESSRRVITVASSDQRDRPSDEFTNFGLLVDVAAPGGGPSVGRGILAARRNILSLRSSAIEETDPFIVAGDYFRLAGTSMAAPHVSGVVALLRSAHPELDYEGIRRVLRQSAADLGPPGHDREMGAGRVDALAALTLGALPDLEAAITSPAQGSLYRPGDAAIEVGGRVAGADLLDWSLLYGVGNDPESWVPVVSASTQVVDDGVLGRIPTRDLGEGSYVVKLEARSSDGRLYSEFLQLSVERNSFFQVSSVGLPATQPAISGQQVLWASRRDPGFEGSDPADAFPADYNLFVSDLATGLEHAVQTGPGDQTSASISRGLIAWLEARDGGPKQVYACRLDVSDGSCPELAVTAGQPVSLPPALAGGRVFWIDSTTGTSDLHGCLPDPLTGRCEEYDLGLRPAIRGWVSGNGDSLTWLETEGGRRFIGCEVDSEGGACPAVPRTETILPLSNPVGSGSLAAWVEFRIRGGKPLKVCAYDVGTGECPEVWVDDSAEGANPRVSGNRLVWVDTVGDENGDIFFCEYDSLRERCPVQRLTAHMSPQSLPAIDGHRVVWEDAREGAKRIYGIELPRLARLRDRRVRERHWLRLFVHAWLPDESGQPLELAAESAGEASLESLGAKLVQLPHRGGRSLGVLLWRPEIGQAGQYDITLSATTASGLVTRQTIRVEVEDAWRRPGRRRWSSWLAHLWRNAGHDGSR